MSVNLKNSLCVPLLALVIAGSNAVGDAPSPAIAAPSPDNTAAASTATTTAAYALGTLVEFKTGGNSERYRVSGWSHTEVDFTWTEGQSAVLSFNLPADPGPLILKMKLAGLIKAPELTFQPVEIYVNQQKIATWQVGDTAEFKADVPPALINKGVLNLQLRMPKATSPKALGKNQDERVLGVCAFNLAFARP